MIIPPCHRRLLSRMLMSIRYLYAPEKAMKALEILFNNKEKIHACDTEVCNIDLSKQGPVEMVK